MSLTALFQPCIAGLKQRKTVMSPASQAPRFWAFAHTTQTPHLFGPACHVHLPQFLRNPPKFPTEKGLCALAFVTQG
jgi:hypothetical protein